MGKDSHVSDANEAFRGTEVPFGAVLTGVGTVDKRPMFILIFKYLIQQLSKLSSARTLQNPFFFADL